MQTRATHPKTARREEKSDKKKEERIGAQLMAEINEPTDVTGTATISDTWKLLAWFGLRGNNCKLIAKQKESGQNELK